jgi:hypothetical protein
LDTVPSVAIIYSWRGDFGNDEVNALHAEAFETRIFDESDGTGASS